MRSRARKEAYPSHWNPSNRMCGIPTSLVVGSCGIATGGSVSREKLDLLQGTLDLMVPRTLVAMGQMHGHVIARLLDKVSGKQEHTHTGPHGSSHPRGDGADARVWHCAAHRASERKPGASEPGNDLCFAGAVAATRVDFSQMGDFRQRAPGKRLFHYPKRQKTAGR